MTIREYLKTLLQGVKTYVDEKIVKSDWNENDENSTSYINNRTHYDARVETTKIITFDGNFEDKEVLKPIDYQWFVRLSDDYVSAEKLIGKNIEYYNGNNGSTTTIQVTNDLITQGGSYQSIQNSLILCEGEVGIGPIKLTKGIWIMCEMNGETPLTYVSSLEVPVTEGEVKTLDEMYLPETTKYQSDWNVNDETSTSYIKNRTHYDARVETVKTITFDGTFEGKEVVKDTFDTDKWFTKVSDEYFPSDKMIGKNISMCADGESMSFPIASNGIYKEDGYYILYGYVAVCEKEVKVILREQIGTYVILTKGVWFLSDVDEETSTPHVYISSLDVPVLEGEVKTLDEMYLPETTKYQSDWNINDEADPAFIKNRPFYDIENILVEQQIEAEFDPDSDNCPYAATESGNYESLFEEGKEYYLEIDGKEYLVEYRYDNLDESYGFGSPYRDFLDALPTGEGLPYPFFIANYGSYLSILTTEVVSGNFKIYTKDGVKYLNPKYIKDMYYETEPVKTVLLEETNVEIDEELYSQLPLLLYAEIGKTYYITFNGVNYECVAWDNGDSANIIGNGTIYGGEGQGEDVPFSIDTYGDGTCYLNTLEQGAYTISISGTQSIIYKIDEKYLPNSLFETIGKSVAGNTYIIDGEEVIARDGAEIFNSYIDNDSNEVSANIAIGYYSHAEGGKTQAYGEFSHAEGCHTIAGDYSHAEGTSTIASGRASHAEGYNSESRGDYSHAEGNESIASGNNSHAEGCHTVASNTSAHAEGFWTIASGKSQHVQGKFNIEDTANKYAHIVGNGTSKDAKSNAHTLDWDGNAWFAGNVLVGGTSQDDASILATETYADNAANTVKNDLLNGAINEMNTTIGDIETALDTILGV